VWHQVKGYGFWVEIHQGENSTILIFDRQFANEELHQVKKLGESWPCKYKGLCFKKIFSRK
jgi:hypothetical protein